MASHLFRANNMLEALEDIQQELGTEAIVVSVREYPNYPSWQMWRKKGVEVIAIPGNLPAKAIKEEPPVEVKQDGLLASAPMTFDEGFPGMRQHDPAALLATKMAERSRSVSRALKIDALEETSQHLLQQGVDSELVEKIVMTCSRLMSPKTLEDPLRIRAYVSIQLKAGLRTRSQSSLSSDRIVCLIGRRGSGKTIAVAKLANLYAQIPGYRVSWICADTIRAGAIPEAKVYADALGIPLHLAYTPGELVEIVNNSKEDDLILIDTQGCNPRSEQEVVQLGRLLTALPRRTTYMLAPATAKEDDLLDARAAFGVFNLQGIIASKLDDTSSFGDLHNFAWRTKIPLAYFTFESGIKDGLLVANPGLLVDALMRGSWSHE
jgi:flagellar biosynthesis protein FlhF